MNLFFIVWDFELIYQIFLQRPRFWKFQEKFFCCENLYVYNATVLNSEQEAKFLTVLYFSSQAYLVGNSALDDFSSHSHCSTLVTNGAVPLDRLSPLLAFLPPSSAICKLENSPRMTTSCCWNWIVSHSFPRWWLAPPQPGAEPRTALPSPCSP